MKAHLNQETYPIHDRWTLETLKVAALLLPDVPLTQLPHLWSVGFHDIEVEWTSLILQLQGQFLFTLVIYCIHLFHYFIIK